MVRLTLLRQVRDVILNIQALSVSGCLFVYLAGCLALQLTNDVMEYLLGE